MAAGFKKATVNASDVPATLTNYPAYVDLSRVGITTLAEAQSVRCYSDSAKTTELAREIVSATQMHVKVPSLTSTFVLYVDYDGVRADYAVTDTYGRNAVWSDFLSVYHLEESSGNRIDSTGRQTLTDFNTVLSATGQIGVAADFESANSEYLSAGVGGFANAINGATVVSVSCSVKPESYPSGGANGCFFNACVGGNNGGLFLGTFDTNKIRVGGRSRSADAFQSTSYTNGAATTFFTIYATWDFPNDKIRLTYDGTQVYDTTVSFGNSSFTVASPTIIDSLGNQNSVNYYDGLLDEVRIYLGEHSANWRTTQHHNQSDEAGFWGTWTDVSGGGPTAPRNPLFFGSGL